MSRFSFLRLLFFPILAIVICTSVSFAESLNLKYQFERPVIEQVEIDGTIYDRVNMSDAPNSGDVGHPSLPSRGAKILLPYGTEVENIEIITSDKHILGSGYYIVPAEEPFPLSARPEEIPPLQNFLLSIYSVSGFFHF